MNHFLSLEQYSPKLMRKTLRLARLLKRVRYLHRPVLRNKSVALLFEKPSNRTRVSFEVAVSEHGGKPIYLGPQEVGLGTRESVADVARSLSRYVHAIVVRTFAHETLEELAAHASVPVINALTDKYHPCQVLADLMTIWEMKGRLKGKKVVFLGDANNVAHSWLWGAALTGMELVLCTPSDVHPDLNVWDKVQERALETGAVIRHEHSPKAAVENADVLYTDVWVSMGQDREDLSKYRPYQLNQELLDLAHPSAIVMHCLPAHRGEEITEEVLEGSHSVVFRQAENRLHVQKALFGVLRP